MTQHIVPVREVTTAHEALELARLIHQRRAADKARSEAIVRAEIEAARRREEADIQGRIARRKAAEDARRRQAEEDAKREISESIARLRAKSGSGKAMRIIRWVAFRYRIQLEDILNAGTSTKNRKARRLAICLIKHGKETCSMSSPQIASIMNCDHSTVLLACRGTAAAPFTASVGRVPHEHAVTAIMRRLKSHTWAEIGRDIGVCADTIPTMLRAFWRGQRQSECEAICEAIGVTKDELRTRLAVAGAEAARLAGVLSHKKARENV